MLCGGGGGGGREPCGAISTHTHLYINTKRRLKGKKNLISSVCLDSLQKKKKLPSLYHRTKRKTPIKKETTTTEIDRYRRFTFLRPESTERKRKETQNKTRKKKNPSQNKQDERMKKKKKIQKRATALRLVFKVAHFPSATFSSRPSRHRTQDRYRPKSIVWL